MAKYVYIMFISTWQMGSCFYCLYSSLDYYYISQLQGTFASWKVRFIQSSFVVQLQSTFPFKTYSVGAGFDVK